MRILFLGIALLLTGAAQLEAATYYVDYANGSNTGSGTSTRSPWKHCPGDPAASGIPATTHLVPGDVVLFRGGVDYVFTGATGIVLQWNGASGKPITYDGNSAGGWGTGRARFTDHHGGNAVAAFSAASLRQHLVFRALEFHRIGGSATVPANAGSAVAPRFGGGIVFGGGADTVTVDGCVFRDLGYVFNTKPMGSESLNGVGISATLARNLKINACQFTRVAHAVDFGNAKELTTVEIKSASFQNAVVWPLRLPVGLNAASAASVSVVSSTTAADTTFAAGTWSGFGHGPSTDVATVAAGTAVTLYATATASPAPSYQWRKNGVPIAGKTGATLRLSSVGLTDAGIYTAVATNAAGSATSNSAVLVVNSAPVVNVAPAITTQPRSVALHEGARALMSVAATGTPAPAYAWRKNGVLLAGQTSSTLDLASVRLADAGNYTVTVSNIAGTVTSMAATLTVQGATVAVAPGISQQPVSQTVNAGADVSFSVSAGGSPAPTYQWRKNGAAISGATGSTLNLSGVNASSAGTYSVVVSNSAGSVTSANANLAVRIPPAITRQPVSQTVNAGANVSFSVAASGSPSPTYQWRKNGAAISGATGTTLNLAGVNASTAGTYSVVVSNAAGSVTSVNATLTVRTPPVFTQHPASQTVSTGARVTFLVSVSGSPAPTLQWRKNGVAISGATGLSYTIPSAASSSAGVYSVVATNAVGVAISNGGTLTLSPTATAKPLVFTQTVLANAPERISFTITGTTPRRVLLRAVGPSLQSFGTTDVLTNPVVEIYQGRMILAGNDNWGGSITLQQAFAEAGTFPLASPASADAALLYTLAPGTYDVLVRGSPSSTGRVLIEVYEMP